MNALHRLLLQLRLRQVAPLAVWAALATHACAFEQIQKLTAIDANGPDTFGNSVAISGNVAIIGADHDSVYGSSSGSAYIYRQSADGTWHHEYKLVPNDGKAAEVFGMDVDISGNRAIVGAFFDDDRGQFAGSAYIFQEDGSGRWQQAAKLFGDDTSEIDHFGINVGISGNTAVVGANLDDHSEPGGDDIGTAYIFQEDTAGAWRQVAKLLPSDGRSRDHFGESVAIDGLTAVIGAPEDDEGNNETGAAFVFRAGADGRWRQMAKLTASDAGNSDSFGWSVAISGDDIIVGANGGFSGNDYPGAAYIFREDQSGRWNEIAKLTASDAEEGDRFSSVAISGEWAVVGAYRDSAPLSNSGSAYVFHDDGNGWSEVAKIAASDGGTDDWFGYSVGISGSTVLVGADRNAGRGIGAGAAYLFRPAPIPEPGSLVLAAMCGALLMLPRFRRAVSGSRPAR
jgi:hypothetical protein